MFLPINCLVERQKKDFVAFSVPYYGAVFFL